MATAIGSPTKTWETAEELLSDLGEIAPARVLIKPPPGMATEADLIALNAEKRGVFELVDGVLVEKGMGYAESALALVLAGYLRAFVVAHNLGIVSGADGMMRLFPGLVRGPDVAYASWDRIPGRAYPAGPIAGFAPDLAVEVLSVSNTPAEMARKRREYFRAGVRLVWEVDPRARAVDVYESPDRPIRLEGSGALDGGAVLPGFALRLSDLFAELDRQGG